MKFKRITATLALVAALVASSFFVSGAQARSQTIVIPHVTVCYQGVTASVDILTAVFVVTHGGHLGACAVAPPAALVYTNPQVWLCNAGLFVDYVSHLSEDLGNGVRPANEILSDIPKGAQGNANGTGYFTCNVPAGAKLVPNMLADSEGYLHNPSEHNIGTVIYPAYKAG